MAVLGKRLRLASAGLLTAGFLFLAPSLLAQGPQVILLEVKGTVNPALAGYIDRGIEVAQARNARAVVIALDTPGGLDQSMRDIVQHIVNSRVPVIVYVAPAGARAASAGTYITMAAHIAAMAPGTEIGAATPVSLGPGGEQQQDDALTRKVVNDAVAYIRSLADLRGRNADWAEEAVRKGASITAAEALRLGVVDIIAPSLPSLLEQAHGRRVQLLEGEVTLSLRGAEVVRVRMTWLEQFLFVVSNPNVAFILLSLALLAIFFELANPGTFVPGIVGGTLLLVSLYALGTLPVNWTGVLLIVLAFILFVAEVFVPSHGVLGIGGVVALVIGAMMLFTSREAPNLRVDYRVVFSVAGAMALFFLLAVRAIVSAHRRRPTVGLEDMVGKVAEARTPLNPEGLVVVEGERWRAVSAGGPVAPGEKVVVERVENLCLYVRPYRQEEGG